MQNLWNDTEAAQFKGELGARVYTSRLLGRDKTLVMHGGGNTSVKIRETNIFGRNEEILYVKGSGWDLETIEAPGFSPVKLSVLLELAKLPRLTDVQMANELRCAMTNASAPMPSVEAILHATLPYKYIDHTHADAIIALTNTPDGHRNIKDAFGDSVVIIPYVMPGFKLARLVAELFPQHATAKTTGMILLKHGIFTFGDTAREAYTRMIECVGQAEDYLEIRGARHISYPTTRTPTGAIRGELAQLRHDVSRAAGFPMILSLHSDAQSLAFAQRDDLSTVARQGPLTPDHVIRTKRLPLIGRDVPAYCAEYERYFHEHAAKAALPLSMLDPAPRIILDAEWGLIAIGRTAREVAIGEDIYRHTMDVILQATALGGYEALPPADIFDVEYWDLEQAKLRGGGKPPVFEGEVALVTGAASGIGKACVNALLARGAAVVGLDLNSAIQTTFTQPDYLGIPCDITDETALTNALEAGVKRFGGLDMLVLNAGIFPAGISLNRLSLADWDKVMRVNLDANVSLLREAHPLLKCGPRGGRVVVIGSKNVPAPGPGAASYSASKAALNQLARVAALEWGGDNIRINTVHPNAVFDTGLWTEEVLANRAKHYGLTVEQYKTNNLLKVEVTSKDVAEMVAEMCGPVFRCTTGAQVPIDGGNDRVI